MGALIQTDLQLSAHDHAAKMVSLLRASDRWLRAAEILSLLGLEVTESNRRTIRAIAEELGAEIITGQPGYRHIENATDDEVKHFANWMRSQGGKMITRADAALERKGIDGQSGSDPP